MFFVAGLCRVFGVRVSGSVSSQNHGKDLARLQTQLLARTTTRTRNDPKRDNDELKLTARYRRNDSRSDPRHSQEEWSLNVVVVVIGGWACNSTPDN